MGHTGLHPRLEASVGVIVTMRHGGLCSIYVVFSSIAADIGTQHVALPWVLVLLLGRDGSEERLLYRHDEVCIRLLADYGHLLVARWRSSIYYCFATSLAWLGA